MGAKSMPKGGAVAPPSSPMQKSDDDWRAESDHRTLSEASDIQSDPKRMAGAKKQHGKQVKKLSTMQRTMFSGGRR